MVGLDVIKRDCLPQGSETVFSNLSNNKYCGGIPMRKVTLYIAMSLDGFIADKNSSVDWLSGDGSDPNNEGSYDEFIETVDTVILGYNTYHQVTTQLSPDEWVYKGKKSYVLTSKKIDSSEEIIFTNENPVVLINRLKQHDGKDIWVCGGASIINQFIANDLIDHYCITVIPTILGGGIRLFAEQCEERKLKLLSTRIYNGMVDLVYECRQEK